MTLDHLSTLVASGAVDTVMVAAPDPFGRLVGKRFRAEHFLQSIATHGTHGCSYLLTVNLEMDPLNGFEVANWAAGFGDFVFRPDLATLRLIPWQPATVLVICDLAREDGTFVAEAPRTVLRRQLERLASTESTCECATELEFYLFNQTYPELFAGGYRELRPSSDYRIDYHLMQPGRDEPLMRAIRNQLTIARVPVESSKGEWSRGQHEINFIHASPLEMSDRHVLFKQGVKELASQHGKSATFMAKYAPTEAGNSCHIHLSLWSNGCNQFWAPPDDSGVAGSPMFRQFLGGLLRYSRELGLCFAPTINSYKRYQSASWAPTRMAWSTDNRTCGFRVVGHAGSFRVENRMPGGDANPYFALSAMLAAGLAGMQEGLDCGAAHVGNAYLDPALQRLPATLAEATDLFEHSALARRAFGDAVVDFQVRHARLEVEAYGSAVTDWEKQRYLEQI